MAPLLQIDQVSKESQFHLGLEHDILLFSSSFYIRVMFSNRADLTQEVGKPILKLQFISVLRITSQKKVVFCILKYIVFELHSQSLRSSIFYTT